MTQIIKNKIEIWNRRILRNLFWLVPLNFILMTYGVSLGIYQSYKIAMRQKTMLYNSAILIKNDSVSQQKIDSLSLFQKDAKNLMKIVNKRP